MDDGCREVGGISCRDTEGKVQVVVVREHMNEPLVVVPYWGLSTLHMSVTEARRLALHLNLIARRIEDRAQA